MARRHVVGAGQLAVERQGGGSQAHHAALGRREHGSPIAEQRRGEDGPTNWGMEITCSTNGILELPEKEHLQKGIPKEELTRTILAVGGNDINTAN